VKEFADWLELVFICAVVALAVYSCDSGKLGRPCKDNGVCDPGLVCTRVYAPIWVCELPGAVTPQEGK